MFRTSSLCDFHAVVDVTTLICLVFQYQIIRTIHCNTTQYIEYNTLKYKYGKLQGKFPALSVVLFLKTRKYSTLAKHKCLGRDHFAPPPPLNPLSHRDLPEVEASSREGMQQMSENLA